MGRHWLGLLLAAVGLAVLIVALAIVAKWSRISMNIFLDHSMPVTANPQDYEPPTGEVVTFMSRDGRSLRGMFVDRPPGVERDRGTVLFCHEFGSNMYSAGRYGRALIDAGYTVFSFDFRSHGESSTPRDYEVRPWPSHHEVNDLLAALYYVAERRDIERTGVGILGISRGASAAVVAAALDPRIRCLALDSVFSTDYSLDHFIRRWALIFANIDLSDREPTFGCRLVRAISLLYVELKLRCRFPSARKALMRLDHVPALFIAGERDAYVRPEYQRHLYDVKAGEKEIWVCPKAKHNQAVATDPEAYAANLVGFFNKHLAGAETDEASASTTG
jgi:pimeloyl-ACP methyl ester carboxylesterase